MLVDRMIRAARLEVGLYEEVERDLTATTQALYVVIIVSLASGVGGFIGTTLAGRPGQAIMALIYGVIAAILGWVVWSFVAYWIGTTFMGGTATPGELLRTIGFANTPNVLQFFSFIWIVGGLISLVAFIWAVVAGVVAVRQALDIDTGKAVITVILGAIAVAIVTVVLGLFLGVAGLFGA